MVLYLSQVGFLSTQALLTEKASLTFVQLTYRLGAWKTIYNHNIFVGHRAALQECLVVTVSAFLLGYNGSCSVREDSAGLPQAPLSSHRDLIYRVLKRSCLLHRVTPRPAPA